MEMQEPWLTCRMGKKLFLLARDATAYYIIEVNKRLDYATEEWLMQQGVSEELLKELLLAFEYIPRSALRGVAIGGCTAGDAVYVYMESAKRKLTLEMDYDEEWMEGFFRDIPRFAAPKKDREKKTDLNWRKDKQDPELFEKLRFVSPVCLVAGICASVGYVRNGHWFWFTLCLLLLAVQMGLIILMPVYFTVAKPKKLRKRAVWELDIPLITMTLILMFRFRINWLSYDRLWIVAGLGAAAGVLLFRGVRDLRTVKWGLLVAVIYGALAGYYLIGSANEVYDIHPRESYVLEVEDLRSTSSRKGVTSYYCTVILPDGREVELKISGNLYRNLNEGNYVQVEHGQGAFGIEYANAYQLD